VKSTWFCKLFD